MRITIWKCAKCSRFGMSRSHIRYRPRLHHCQHGYQDHLWHITYYYSIDRKTKTYRIWNKFSYKEDQSVVKKNK